MNRRTFLATSAAAAVFPPHLGAQTGARKIDKIGLQLYTVRGELKRDFEGTLTKVASIGYRQVEFAGYFDHEPQAIHVLLNRLGISSPSCHVDYRSLGKPLPRVLEAARAIGHRYLVCPWIDEEIRRQPDGWKRAAETLNQAGEASKKAGIQFGYHNHDFEFHPIEGQPDKLPYDILLAETDPQLVKMELDLFWITNGGQDPLAYFDRYPGRFALVHVKDRTADGKMTDVGSGAIDWAKIFAQSEKAGIKHYFVEHDQPKSPFDSIRNSYEYLRKLRF